MKLSNSPKTYVSVLGAEFVVFTLFLNFISITSDFDKYALFATRIGAMSTFEGLVNIFSNTSPTYYGFTLLMAKLFGLADASYWACYLIAMLLTSLMLWIVGDSLRYPRYFVLFLLLFSVPYLLFYPRFMVVVVAAPFLYLMNMRKQLTAFVASIFVLCTVHLSAIIFLLIPFLSSLLANCRSLLYRLIVKSRIPRLTLWGNIGFLSLAIAIVSFMVSLRGKIELIIVDYARLNSLYSVNESGLQLKVAALVAVTLYCSVVCFKKQIIDYISLSLLIVLVTVIGGSLLGPVSLGRFVCLFLAYFYGTFMYYGIKPLMVKRLPINAVLVLLGVNLLMQLSTLL